MLTGAQLDSSTLHLPQEASFPRCLQVFSCCLANSQTEILKNPVAAFSCLPTHHRLVGVGSAAWWEGPQPFGCCGLLLVVFKALLYSSKFCPLSRDIKAHRRCKPAQYYMSGSWPDPSATNVVHRARHGHKTLFTRAQASVSLTQPAMLAQLPASEGSAL